MNYEDKIKVVIETLYASGKGEVPQGKDDLGWAFKELSTLIQESNEEELRKFAEYLIEPFRDMPIGKETIKETVIYHIEDSLEQYLGSVKSDEKVDVADKLGKELGKAKADTIDEPVKRAMDEPRNSEPTKKKFEAFYQTNHNNPSFLPMWNYFQEMYSDKPANIEKIKEEFEKTFQTEVETKGTRRVWGNATDVWNFFLPYLSSIGKGDK